MVWHSCLKTVHGVLVWNVQASGTSRARARRAWTPAHGLISWEMAAGNWNMEMARAHRVF